MMVQTLIWALLLGPWFPLVFCPECEGAAPVKYKRRAAVIRQFKKANPCPDPSGSCRGWKVDHVVALDCAGTLGVDKRELDVVDNLQWQDPVAAAKKDRWERQGEACHTLYKLWQRTRKR